MVVGRCRSNGFQAAPIKPQRRHQEFSVVTTVMRHLFVFICDEIEPDTLGRGGMSKADNLEDAWVREGSQ